MILHRNLGLLLSPVYKYLKDIFQIWPFSIKWRNSTIFCHSWISLIWLIHLFLPNLYFYTIRSIAIFFKVLNKVTFKCLPKPTLFLLIRLLPFTKLLELLAINHSSYESRITFVPWLLKFFHLLIVLWLAWVHTFLHLSWRTWSSLAPFPGCQGSWVPNGPAGSVVSFNIRQGLKCKHVTSTPTLNMWLLSSNYALLWTTKFVGVFSKTDTA